MSDLRPVTLTTWTKPFPPHGEMEDRLDVDSDEGNTLGTFAFEQYNYDHEGDPSEPRSVVNVTIPDLERLGTIKTWDGDEYVLTPKEAPATARQIADEEVEGYGSHLPTDVRWQDFQQSARTVARRAFFAGQVAAQARQAEAAPTADPRVEGNATMGALADALDDRGNHAAAEWLRDNASDDALYEYVGKLLDMFERFAGEDD